MTRTSALWWALARGGAWGNWTIRMQPWTRRLAFIAALGVLLGGAALAIARTGAQAATGDSVTVYITSTGINPTMCIVSRNDTVQFKNETSATQRIFIENTEFTSPDIAAGDTWSGMTITAGGTYRFYVVDHPDWKGEIYNPQFQQSSPRNCNKQTPTPTPTATPVRTASPTATATLPPPPPQLAPNCFGKDGCAVAPWLAFDGGS